MSLFSGIFSAINIGSNWLLILLFLAAGLGYGMVMGRNRLGLITLAGYFSLLVSKAIPWVSFGFSKGLPDSNVLIFIFLATILGVFFLAPHSGLGATLRVSGRGKASWWQLLIIGTTQIGFLASAIISFLPDTTIADLSPFLKQFFVNDLTRFFWIAMPMLALLALKKRRTYTYSDEE